MQKSNVSPRLKEVPWREAANTEWFLTQRENLPTSPSNGTETWWPSEAVPIGQMPHTTRFGSNQVITQGTVDANVPKWCPFTCYIQCWTGKPPLRTGLLFLPKKWNQTTRTEAQGRNRCSQQALSGIKQSLYRLAQDIVYWFYSGEIFATSTLTVAVSDLSNCSIKKPSLPSCEKARSKPNLGNQDSKIQEPFPSLLKALDQLCSLALTCST